MEYLFINTQQKGQGASDAVNMSYDHRLHTLGLQSVEHRHVFNDPVLCYKMKSGLVDIDFIVVNNSWSF